MLCILSYERRDQAMGVGRNPRLRQTLGVCPRGLSKLVGLCGIGVGSGLLAQCPEETEQDPEALIKGQGPCQ